MGHDISAIGNHKLNTDSIKELAEDITSRIDINIEYGYYGQRQHFKLLGVDKEDSFVIIDKIIKHTDFKTFVLVDEAYQIKELHNKFGNNLFNNPDYWIYYDGELPDPKIILEERKKVLHPSYVMELEDKDGYQYLTISKEHYENSIPYYSRWWCFCRFFIEKSYSNNKFLNDFNNFRKELMHYTFRFGGDTIYYLDDQSDVLEGVGQGSEWDMSWDSFEKFVSNKTSHLMLDIPKFLTDEEYRSEFHKLDEYPLSFVDNFADIRE